MVKVLATLIFAFSLTGCALFQPRIQTEVVEVSKPILYCPAPNWEGIDRPDPLAYQLITDEMSEGDVAKLYKASVVQLLGYSKRLEKSLQRYDETNAAYEELRKQFLEQTDKDRLSVESDQNDK